MAAISIITAAQKQAWLSKLIPEFKLASLWSNISNTYAVSTPVPGQKDMPIPNAVVMRVTDEFRSGSYKTTALTVLKGNNTPVIGPNIAAGNEAHATLNEVALFWNVRRLGRLVTDRSVEGRIGEYFKLADQVSAQLNMDNVEDTDYNHQRAIIDGADIGLTSASYWQSSDRGSTINAPLSAVLHPNIYAFKTGVLVKNTWSATDATARTNLGTLLSGMAVTDIASLTFVDYIADFVSRNISPIPGGVQGTREVKWVCILSNLQWRQIMFSSAAGGVQDRFKYTNSSIDKVIEGFQGVYRNVLWLVDNRSPLFDVVSAGAATVQYITSSGDSRVPVVLSGTTGTFEIARLLGNYALGMAVAGEERFIEKVSQDYEFDRSLLLEQSYGIRRTDRDTTDAATSARTNITSALFVTATNATV